MVSPVKSMSMSGKIETNPYRLSLRNLYDDSKEVRSQIMFDLEKKIVDAQTSYDIGRYNSHSPIFSYILLNKLKNQCIFLQLISDNPANVLHFVAKYVNASAVLAEVYREENSRRITDSLFAIRLNTSRILHTRIHWRPTMISDLKVILDS